MCLYKMDAALLLIIIEGTAHIHIPVDHPKLFGYQRQKSPLHCNGKKYHAEHQIVKIIVHRHFAQNGHDRKHDGGSAAQSRPGYHANLTDMGPERQKNGCYRRRTGDHRHKQHDQCCRKQDRRKLTGCRQKPQQEEDHHLRNARDRIKHMH